MGKLKLIATAAFGLEATVEREVKKLGYFDTKIENGRVFFEGDALAIARANLWLRSADRVRLVVGEFQATSFDELFEKTKALNWSEIIPKDAEFPVEGKSVKSTLFSVPDCQAIVKKAVVENLKEKHKISWFEESGPLYKIEVALYKDKATLSIDTSGAGLHKRGYRDWIGTAPLKETLAAALIELSFWNPDRLLVDPVCGSGTIAIEAALIGKNIAPGMNRDFSYEEWPNISKEICWQARSETHDLADYDRPLEIMATDIDGEILKVARRNAEEADVFEDIHIQQMALKDFRSASRYGVFICNPPYGERLGEKRDAEKLYSEMGEVFRRDDTWSSYIITSHEGFENFFGKKADKKRKLYNGNIKTDYYQYFGPKPPRRKK